jgi:hypothetical protein
MYGLRINRTNLWSGKPGSNPAVFITATRKIRQGRFRT